MDTEGYGNKICFKKYQVNSERKKKYRWLRYATFWLPFKQLTTLLYIRRNMNSLPDQVKQIIYEYDNTYHEIYDEVINELLNKTIMHTMRRHKPWIADHIQINGIHRIVHNYLWGLGSDLPWRIRTRGGSE